MLNLKNIRKDFPVLSKKVFLDSASAGPPPRQVYRAMLESLEEWYQNGEDWDEVLRSVVECRRLFARLIGAKEEEVALVPNVSTGLSQVATSIRYPEGSNIVLSGLNFPTGIYVWRSLRNAGILKEVRVIEPSDGCTELEGYRKAIDEKTAVVSADYVAWLSGYRERIKEVSELAHESGCLFLCDLFHAAGVIPIDVRRLGIDIALCGTYKWLLGPTGIAFLYVREELLDSLVPTTIGWHGVKDSVVERFRSGMHPFAKPLDTSDAIPSPTASRFEQGAWSTLGVVGAKAALEYAMDIDMDTKTRHILGLSGRLMDDLEMLGIKIITPREDGLRAGIATFGEKRFLKLSSFLERRSITVSVRHGYVRVSIHFFNDEADVQNLIDSVREFTKRI